jgi:hypothetical protein
MISTTNLVATAKEIDLAKEEAKAEAKGLTKEKARTIVIEKLIILGSFKPTTHLVINLMSKMTLIS